MPMLRRLGWWHATLIAAMVAAGLWTGERVVRLIWF
jgi:hypothetical protein